MKKTKIMTIFSDRLPKSVKTPCEHKLTGQFYLAEKPGFELGLIVTICVYLFNLVTNLLLFVQDAPNSSIW